MLSTLLLTSLATLGGFEILRRLLPVRLPVVVGELVVVSLAWVLLTSASRIIVLSLCVPGVFLLIARVIAPEPHVPWGTLLSAWISQWAENKKREKNKLQAVAPQRQVGRRMPKL